MLVWDVDMKSDCWLETVNVLLLFFRKKTDMHLCMCMHSPTNEWKWKAIECVVGLNSRSPVTCVHTDASTRARAARAGVLFFNRSDGLASRQVARALPAPTSMAG